MEIKRVYYCRLYTFYLKADDRIATDLFLKINRWRKFEKELRKAGVEFSVVTKKERN